jgi:hypothetical protein
MLTPGALVGKYENGRLSEQLYCFRVVEVVPGDLHGTVLGFSQNFPHLPAGRFEEDVEAGWMKHSNHESLLGLLDMAAMNGPADGHVRRVRFYGRLSDRCIHAVRFAWAKPIQ